MWEPPDPRLVILEEHVPEGSIDSDNKFPRGIAVIAGNMPMGQPGKFRSSASGGKYE